MSQSFDSFHERQELTDQFASRLQTAREEMEKIQNLLATPETVKNPRRFSQLGRDYARLDKLVSLYDSYIKLQSELDDNQQLLECNDNEPEFRELILGEIDKLQEEIKDVQRSLEEALVPPDERDEKNNIIEIRAGTGGEEAALFVLDLFRMYSKYAENKGLKIESLNTNPAAQGGLKEIVFSVIGEGAFRAFKYESGVHRVQRVPETESQGRIHTSAATVAVLPEVEEVDIKIDPNDLRIDRFCSSGPGGQSVNTTYSAIRITHIPSGIVVSCQDEKSQHKNKASAMKVLRARLFQMMQAEQDAELSRQRKEQIKSGDRSDKIRTYNFPQNRVTDHRIGLSLHCLESVMDGDLDEIVDRLREWDRQQRLQQN